ncbi:fructose-bisphosphate aldolase-lysine N-methyltransferase, chloroplastic isoform X2 [Selaginella moellendorffii]|uniref:fructose-bisphosphate aldolase-lysine N-methyltransferase, chloroplastic isoform X2 n=1 Tax=Selaginella moellendorffii TaxID=88036 RepID=UPI000D1D027A|nr:fructose-bisphosphate aldolase-lysine N-methyltransferase, chloroplastic isoform X2 [Selaginella moellendorffii]XP_024519394.1 fructose-bisphosphate aldolase-lysine N-methyltransferase, chloroplastic isoform X2 [Selaginella moellendorffii]|eukprot:XP_024519340.1 fructose-bisphosphate aldolase-lysine N-methyltransferase, chloroplastic isoform X2 [Selaginella moellendorffii]
MWARALCLAIDGNAGLGRRFSCSTRIHAYAQNLGSSRTHLEFMSWLRRRGEDMNSIAVAIGMSKHGRALFAHRPMCAGECMIKFSQNLVLTPEKLPCEVIALLDQANEFTRVSLLVMAEKRKGQNSAWAPYIECLPSFGEIHSTIFWDPKELACLECSPIHRGTGERNALLQSEYREVKKVVESCPHLYDPDVSLEQFKHEYATVSSRAWGQGPHSDMTMIPLVDFANHDPRSRTLFSHADDNCTVVVASRDYQTGDEVHICYGDHSNAVLALDYGFVVPDNPFDEAEIFLEIPSEDPLREIKLQYMAQNNMNTLRDSNGTQTGGRPFTIMEVTSRGGKEVVVPSAARAFARIITSDSLADLQELNRESEVYGVVPFASRPRHDRRKEQRATNLLLALIEAHADEHKRAIQSLEATALRPERRYIAECVLQGELSLLLKASTSEIERYGNNS